MGRLDGQVAWVTGAASGIGKAIAVTFAAEGAKVAALDIDAELGEPVVKEINDNGGEAIFIKCDVAREAEVQEALEQTAATFNGLDILANNAGIVQVGPLDECTEEAWDRLMGINVKSIFFSLKHAMPHLRKNDRSYVVNIGSISSFVGQGSTPGYTTSKHAVLGLSRSIALDYAADGIRCNCICPGITETPLLHYHLNKTPDPEGALATRLRRVPMGIALAPEDIAKAAVYFACEDSAGITGTSLVVDCGYTTAAEWDTDGRTKFMDSQSE